MHSPLLSRTRATPQTFRTIPFLAGALGIAVTVQYPFTFFGDLPIMINLADGLLALAFILLTSSISTFLVQNIRKFDTLLLMGAAAFSVAIALSLVIGWFNNSHLTVWAFKKSSGWMLLLAYAVMSAHLTWRGGQVSVKYFSWAFIISIVFQILLFIMLDQIKIIDTQLHWGHRMAGLMSNPSAMAYELLGAICILQLYLMPLHSGKHRVILHVLFGVLVIGLLLTISVSAIGISVVLFPYFALRARREKVLPAFLVVIAFVALAYGALVSTSNHFSASSLKDKEIGASNKSGQKSVVQNEQGLSEAYKSKSVIEKLIRISNGLTGTGSDSAYQSSIGARLQTMIDAWLLFRSNPLFGAGLGSYVENSQQDQRQDPDNMEIHNLYAWIAGEMGLFGVAAFALLLCAILRVVWLKVADATDMSEQWHLAHAFFVVLTASCVIYMTGDYFYQRWFWILLGFALLAPKTKGSQLAPV